MNTYKLMFIKGIHQLDRKQKNYPKENWGDDIPKIENYGIGKDTRFKKKKNTLKNSTHKGTTLPKESDPFLETSLDDQGVFYCFGVFMSLVCQGILINYHALG